MAKTGKSFPKIRFIAFLFLVSLLLASVAVISYQIGKNEKQYTPTNQYIPVSATPNLIPSTSITPTKQPGYETGSILLLEDTSDLKQHGVMLQNPNYSHEAYIFADLTESNFSGKVLTQIIPLIKQRFPQIRLWYLHTVLQYRDTPNTRSAIATLKCLADQGAVWQNMESLVKNSGRHDYVYDLPDQEKYIGCITSINQDKKYFDNYVKEGQDLMVKYRVAGVPTIIIAPVQYPSEGTYIIGALPTDQFEQEIIRVLP